MEYPHIPQHFSKEELFEHFTLSQVDRYNLPLWRKEKNILGFAVLLKSYLLLGYPPRRKKDVPASVVSFIGQQLDVHPSVMKATNGKAGCGISISPRSGITPVSGLAKVRTFKSSLNGW